MNRSIFASVVFSSLALAAISGCGEQTLHPADTPPVKKHVETLVSSNMPSATGGYSQAVTVQLTLDKSRILGREFIYGLDLQFSSKYDESMDLYTQSETVAHVPVTFRVMGNELQLVTNNKLKFPSDNNHPEDVIGRFAILAETNTTLTVSGLNSAPYLASQLGPVDDKSKVINYLDHWIRTFDFDTNGNYMLQQTSLKLSDKAIVEFMESIYPRENIAPGPLFKKFEMDPEDPVGADDGDVARFRFLPGDAIIQHDKNGEKKLAYSQHFDISPKADGTPGTIDWYVTDNIPDEYVAPVKQAVEGWNRYFVKMKGIERPVMRFMGKIALSKIGDPRYNIINWDSRLKAGAAYESQVSDPETGKQSHSLIYMPAAWLKIGSDYWKKGMGSDETASATPVTRLSKAFNFQRNLNCARDLRDGVGLMRSGRLTADELKQFGVQLLKQTLFHEVGHALGFDHNFKGSLSYMPSEKDPVFSTSIMDYNDYELERKAFSDVNSADGPLLEYDRQVLSAIYNEGKDLEGSKVLPACNDAEADNEAGGVDPLCIRYDLQKDPTQSISTAISRVENETVDAQDVSLAQALARMPKIAVDPESFGKVESQDDIEAAASAYASALKGTLDFYIASDVSALLRTTRTNIKALLDFGGPVPESYNEAAMRERVFAGIQKSLALKELPEAPKKALEKAIDEGVNAMGSAPYFLCLSEKKQGEELTRIKKLVADQVQKYMADPAGGLAAGRAKLLASLARHSAVDFSLKTVEKTTTDYEKNVVALLADVVSNKDRAGAERLAAATALKTFKGRLAWDDVISVITKKLQEERAAAASNAQRRTIEGVLKALGLTS